MANFSGKKITKIASIWGLRSHMRHFSSEKAPAPLQNPSCLPAFMGERQWCYLDESAPACSFQGLHFLRDFLNSSGVIVLLGRIHQDVT